MELNGLGDIGPGPDQRGLLRAQILDDHVSGSHSAGRRHLLNPGIADHQCVRSSLRERSRPRRDCAGALDFQTDRYNLAARWLCVRRAAPDYAFLIVESPYGPYRPGVGGFLLDPLTGNQFFIEQFQHICRRSLAHHLPFDVPVLRCASGAQQSGLNAFRHGQAQAFAQNLIYNLANVFMRMREISIGRKVA